MKITIEILEMMPSGNRACSDAREWFTESFPNGGDAQAVWDACHSNYWRIWFAVNYAAVDVAVKFANDCAARAADAADAADADYARAYADRAADHAADAAAYAARADYADYAAACADSVAADAIYAAAYVDLAARAAEIDQQLEWAAGQLGVRR